MTMDAASRAVRDLIVNDDLRLKVMSRISIEANGCWMWTGARNSQGYGQIRVTTNAGEQRAAAAHRISYMCHVGPIPDSCVLDHLCRNAGCVNPDHLEPVTEQVNIRRGVGPTAANAAKTHCNEGHPFTGDNLYIKPRKGERVCRTCKRADDRARQQRRKAQRRSS